MARPSASASARVQVNGGAIAVGKGELVFDGVAISDTSATARRPSAARAGRPLRLRASARMVCAGPAPCAGERRRSLHSGWRRHVPREQHDHAHAGGAPGPTHAIARARNCSTSVRCWHWHWHECLMWYLHAHTGGAPGPAHAHARARTCSTSVRCWRWHRHWQWGTARLSRRMRP